jgi:class 3 adenylate cyclase/tetratricopeptide (TPR) repeat protein
LVCSTCGTENEPGRKFCKECAARLAAVCPSCGAGNSADAKFCGECAAPLVARASPAASTSSRPSPPTGGQAPVAERRLVSVLFADLVGFTPFAEERDAEDVRDTLNRYFDLASDVIGRYGGTVEKFIGDAVMAVWGAPIAHEDDAERAVRAALELVDAVRALGPAIQARAGVLTGEAAVTIGALNQGMVAGDIVNTASRLQAVAAPGTVLVGEATQRSATRAIAFEPAGDQTLKGKAAPVPAWRALRIVAEVGGRNRSDALEAPFVGRDEELRLLKDLFHATGREKRVRLVSVIGPAGIGKTRLASEFLKYADGLVDDTYWHEGRSPAHADGITFWALGEMVRRRAGLLETDDEPTTRARIDEMVRRWIDDDEERRWIEPALLALLGLESGIAAEQLFAAWRTFFERIAAHGTVALVFEDFHHADSGLIDFVDHLLEWSRNVPIYVVTLSRPELLERRPEWGAGKRSFVAVHLEPLPAPAMRQLLIGLVPGLPEPAVQAIVARADGIPLYAVETVRMLLAEGRLELRDGVYVPTGDLTDLAVPETLTALIGARLDGLEPADRALVQDAAVLGQSFTLAGLAAVSGISESDLEPHLRGIVRRELLTLEADPRSPERGQYAFVQALIREVAYRTLAKPDRKTRHLAAARFFESLGSDELAGGLAGHYLAAYSNSAAGPEADALATQARITLRAAADRATALGSNAQAMGFLEQALAVTTDETVRAELLELAGGAATAADLTERARSFLEDAIELHRARRDRISMCRATAELGRAMLNGSRTEAAVAFIASATEDYADLAEQPAGVALWAQFARAQFLFGRSAEAVATADTTLALAERLDLVPVLADLLVTKGSALVEVGRLREGLGTIETGRRLAESAGLTFTILRATLNSTGFATEIDPRSSLVAARRGMDLAVRLGLPGFLIPFRETVGFVSIRTGEWEAGLAALNEGLESADVEDRIHLVATIAAYRILRGEPGATDLREIKALVEDQTNPQAKSHLPISQAFIALAQGDPELAEVASDREFELFPSRPDAFLSSVVARTALWSGDAERAVRALARHRTSGSHGPAIEATRLTISAGLDALSGKWDEARTTYRTALRSWHELGLPFDEALTAIDMATLLDPADPEVRAAAESARETFGRLGAEPLRARLEAALGRLGTVEPATADRKRTPVEVVQGSDLVSSESGRPSEIASGRPAGTP